MLVFARRNRALANRRFRVNGSLYGPIGSTAVGFGGVSSRVRAVDPIEHESAPLIGLLADFFVRLPRLGASPPFQ